MRRLALLGFAVLALAGCGGAEPLLSRTTAAPLAKQADAIAARLAAGDACGARDHALALQRRTIASINAGRVPAALQEPLQNRANELVSELEPECLPSVAPESTQPEEAGPSPAQSGHGEQKGHGPKRGKGHDHGQGHGHGHGKGGGD